MFVDTAKKEINKLMVALRKFVNVPKNRLKLSVRKS